MHQASPEDTIDIWQFSLKAQPAEAFILLNKEEQQRALNFHFKKHQRRFITARAMMRVILSRYLDILPEEINFIYNPHGKPGVSGLEFNLSHSADIAMLAVGSRKPLGVDVEIFSHRNWLGIGREMFSDEEYKTLCTLPPHSHALGFFNLWTQKEAFIKVSGLGLNYPTRTFTVPFKAQGQSMIEDPKNHTLMKMFTFMPEPGCCAALCCDKDTVDFQLFNIVPETFLSDPDDIYPFK